MPMTSGNRKRGRVDDDGSVRNVKARSVILKPRGPMETSAAHAALAGADSKFVPLGMAQDTEVGDVVPFELVGGMRVRLDEVVSNLPGLARVIMPLIAGGKKVTRVPEVLQRAAGEVRRMDGEVPAVRRWNRGGKKATSEMTRALDRARESEQNWQGQANHLRGHICRAEDEVGRLQRMNDALFSRGEAEIVRLREANLELWSETHELRNRLNAIGAAIGSPLGQRPAPGGPMNWSPGGGFQRGDDFGAESPRGVGPTGDLGYCKDGPGGAGRSIGKGE